MKARRWRGVLLFGSVVGVAVIALWLKPQPHQGGRADASSLPVERLRAFSTSNAPRTASGGVWSSQLPSEPARAQAIKQIKAQLRTKETSNRTTPAKGPFGNIRDITQAEALRRLQGQVGPSLKVYLRPANSTPVQIKGNPLAKATGSGVNRDSEDEATARTFLRANAALFLLSDPDQELRLAHRETDALGGAVLRFTQQYRGLPVWPAEIGAQLDAKGNLILVDGAYVATPKEVETQPSLTQGNAQTRARAAVGNPDAHIGNAELVIYAPMEQEAKLAWKMDVSMALDQAWWVIIDAQTGDPLEKISRVMDSAVNGSGVDLLGVSQPLSVWQSGPAYFMIDASKPMFNPTTGTGFIEVDDANNQTQEQILPNHVLQNISYVTSSSPNSWPNADAVSAAYNLGQTYDYYLDRFNRSSYNGSGSNLFAVVRIGGLQNAFWSGVHNRMFFGNADLYAGSLDVIGHEVTHGVVGSIGSQGVLFYKSQSGALNEAFADIFGEMIEARTKGTNDWLIGSQLATLIRSMASPGAYNQPGTMSQYVSTSSDNGGVHVNSGIINRAFYLLAAGLQGAIGNEDAERIFYRCLTASMKPFSQFIDARLGCVAAAEYLFGVDSIQALKTAEAFDSVELYAAPASAEQPVSINAAVQAADSAMFIREHWFFTRNDLWRLEAEQGDPAGGTSQITNVQLARPAITGNGAGMFFVGSDESLYFVQTTGAGFTNFNLAGMVHSLAVSPEGRYLAFVFNAAAGIPTNQIALLDLWSNKTATVDLVTPVSDGAPLNNISYADQLSFSPDGKLLIYDALSQLRSADGQLRHAWSIFGMDTETLHQQVVIPPEDQFNIGNPAFSRTSSRFIVFDAQYVNGNSVILTLDLLNGTPGVIGVSHNGVGYPVFNGSDTYVYFAEQDSSTSSGRSIYGQALTADKMSPSGSSFLAISDAKLAAIYRRGHYPNVNTAPTVTLMSPTENALFTAPATITLAVSAGDIDGTVQRVEFYCNTNLLATDTSAPFAYEMSNVPAGIYTVYARAYDNQGASSTTSALRFAVKPPKPPGVLNRAGAPGFEFSLNVPTNGLYRLEASTNLVNWVPLGSFYSSTNFEYLDATATNLPYRFYRVVPTP